MTKSATFLWMETIAIPAPRMECNGHLTGLYCPKCLLLSTHPRGVRPPVSHAPAWGATASGIADRAIRAR